jgi:hypothetical protein
MMGEITQSVMRHTTGWTVQKSNPGGGEIFHNRPDRHWSTHSCIYNENRAFLEGKAAWAWRSSPKPFSAKVKENVELQLYNALGLRDLF